MTAKELIEYLNKLKPNTKIELSIYGCGGTNYEPLTIERLKQTKGKLIIEADDN